MKLISGWITLVNNDDCNIEMYTDGVIYRIDAFDKLGLGWKVLKLDLIL